MKTLFFLIIILAVVVFAWQVYRCMRAATHTPTIPATPRPSAARRPAQPQARANPGRTSRAPDRTTSTSVLDNPIHPLNPLNPIHHMDTPADTAGIACKTTSPTPAYEAPSYSSSSSSSSYSSSDSGSSSSSDSGSSCGGGD